MSLLSRLNPANLMPRFPPYLGPYTVGSFEVEIPVTSLAPPGSVDGIAETVQFRVFYPTQKPVENPASAQAGWWGRGDKKDTEEELSGVPSASSKPVRWLPEPHQREYLSAYARFLGASSGFAEIVSHISRLLHYISLPAIADAPLLPSSPDFRYPTMIFSHGLGGTRLAYSHICCSIASYGVVVIAPEHRDGSAPVSFVKTPTSNPEPQETKISGSKPSSGEPGIDESSATEPKKDTNGRSQVDYLTYPHHVTDETANGRNRQLEIRFRELSLIYSALAKLDLGQLPPDAMISTDDTINPSTPSTLGTKLLSQFQGHLDVHTPGRVIWAGHSFGASTMFQFVKTIFYPTPPEFNTDDFKPLFTPTTLPDDPALPLKQQITPTSPLMLLDLWCLPLLGKRTSHLFKKPLPQIHHNNGRSVLIIMSEEFRKWKENLAGVRRVLSVDPGRKRGGTMQQWFEQWDEEHEQLLAKGTPPMGALENSRLEIGDQIVPPDGTTPAPTRPTSAVGVRDPRFFYARGSAHLSQSDFGILFPRAIRKAVEPRRILELNARAAVQWLREAGFVVGGEEEGKEGIFEGEVEGWGRIGLEEVEKEEVGKW